MNKKSRILIIGIVLLVVMGVVGFVYLNSSGDDAGTSDNDGQSSDSVVTLTGETKEFEIVAKNWEFSPSIIEVNLGDKVELHVESIEGTHGFVISEFGVSETLSPGVDVDFVADKKGSFGFYCSIPCGRGHGGMNGVLIVK